MMKRVAMALGLSLLILVAGCVIRTEHTIDAHITLDIRHVEEQAEDVLDFIEGKSDVLPGLGDAPAADTSSVLQRGLRFFSPIQPVYAEGLKTASPRVSEIAVKLRERNSQIVVLKQKGCLGENNRGYVELRDCDGFKEGEARNAAQKLLADENKDRKALYKEIARLNSEQNLSVSLVERVYALQRLQRGKSGEVYQLPSDDKDFQTIKASTIGKALGDACQPNAWVTIS